MQHPIKTYQFFGLESSRKRKKERLEMEQLYGYGYYNISNKRNLFVKHSTILIITLNVKINVKITLVNCCILAIKCHRS